MDLLDQTPIIATQVLPKSPEPPTLPPAPPKSRRAPLILATLIAILLGATALFSYKYFTLKSQLVVSPTPTPSPTLSAEAMTKENPTTDWKTFSDQKYNFSFKYPPNITIRDGYSDSSIQVVIFGPTQGDATELYDALVLSFDEKTLNNNQTLQEYAQQEFIAEKSNDFLKIIQPLQQTSLSNISGFTYTSEWVNASRFMFFKHPTINKTVTIIDSTNDPTNQGFNIIVSQILSTFKFIDAEVPEITFSTPKSGAAITSPVTIKGTAPKSWTFESILNISIEDDQHQLLSGGPVSTEDVEGSDNLVSFETSVNFASITDTGFITIKNDNPSGLPENDKSFSLPIKFAP